MHYGASKRAVRVDSLAATPATRVSTHDASVESDGKEGTNHMTQLIALISSIRNDDEGQGLAEYALILALIAIVAIIALIFLGGQVSTILSTVGDSV